MLVVREREEQPLVTHEVRESPCAPSIVGCSVGSILLHVEEILEEVFGSVR